MHATAAAGAGVPADHDIHVVRGSRTGARMTRPHQPPTFVATLPLASLLVQRLLAHHPATVAHSLRVARLVALVAAALPGGVCGMSPVILSQDAGGEADIYAAALMHDAGKVHVPLSVLDAPRPLTDLEYACIKDHPYHGVALLRAHGPVAPLVEDACWGHHERWDGRGYPRRLVGEETPPIARLVALCDSFDAMREGRPYRAALSHDAALAEVRRCVGTHFDPALTIYVLDHGLLVEDADG